MDDEKQTMQDVMERPELIERPTTTYSPVADRRLQEVAREAEANVQAYRRILAACIKITNPNDWVDLGGKPYLQVSGAQKIGRLFGISWRPEPDTVEMLPDGHRIYTYTGELTWGPSTITVIGTRSSADAFFSEARGTTIHPNDIDMGDVKKAAFTNWLNRGIKALLGLNNITWDDVRSAGMSADQMSKVQFRQGDKDPMATPTLPNYGPKKGLPLDDATVTVDDLQRYLQGCERSIADPAKAKFKEKEIRMRDALQAEIARRRDAASTTPDESTTEPMAEAEFRKWALEMYSQKDTTAVLTMLLREEKYKDTKAVPPEQFREFVSKFNVRLREIDAQREVR